MVVVDEGHDLQSQQHALACFLLFCHRPAWVAWVAVKHFWIYATWFKVLTRESFTAHLVHPPHMGPGMHMRENRYSQHLTFPGADSSGFCSFLFLETWFVCFGGSVFGASSFFGWVSSFFGWGSSFFGCGSSFFGCGSSFFGWVSAFFGWGSSFFGWGSAIFGSVVLSSAWKRGKFP